MTDIKITINGSECYKGARRISYSDIVRLAGMRGHPTVVYQGPKHGDIQRQGTMYVGCEDLEIEDGMIFTVTHTGNS